MHQKIQHGECKCYRQQMKSCSHDVTTDLALPLTKYVQVHHCLTTSPSKHHYSNVMKSGRFTISPACKYNLCWLLQVKNYYRLYSSTCSQCLYHQTHWNTLTHHTIEHLTGLHLAGIYYVVQKQICKLTCVFRGHVTP